MSKRKQDASDDSSSDVSLINVDFDFFDPNPNVDYHALKRLLTQLFQKDAELFNPHELTELILSQSAIGSTVKTDGMESDPYAILSVLNMHVHQNHPSIQALGAYLLKKSSSNPTLYATLQTLFEQSTGHVGLVICERLINMPVPVIPPMYTMLKNEMIRAAENKEPYTFSHLIFISRAYHLTPEEEAFLTPANARQSSKKSKKSKQATNQTRPADGMYSFHPEDEVIKQFSVGTVEYQYDKAANEPRDRESFGLDTRGRIMLVSADNFADLVTKMNEIYVPT